MSEKSDALLSRLIGGIKASFPELIDGEDLETNPLGMLALAMDSAGQIRAVFVGSASLDSDVTMEAMCAEFMARSMMGDNAPIFELAEGFNIEDGPEASIA